MGDELSRRQKLLNGRSLEFIAVESPYKNPARQPFPPTLLSLQPPPSLYYSLLPYTVFHPSSAYPTMKISSSTSLLFATLAISSSSPCLAAPASDPPSSEPGMTSSPSSQHVAARRDSSAGRALRPPNMQRSIDMARAIVNEDPEARGLFNLLDLDCLICPVAKLLVDCDKDKEKSAGGKQAMFEAGSRPSMSTAEAINNLQGALAMLMDQDASSPPYAPADSSSAPADPSYPADDSSDPADARKDDGDDSVDSDGEQDDSSSSAAAADYDPASASPSLPGNPPNTPTSDMSSTTMSTPDMSSTSTSGELAPVHDVASGPTGALAGGLDGGLIDIKVLRRWGSRAVPSPVPSQVAAAPAEAAGAPSSVTSGASSAVLSVPSTVESKAPPPAGNAAAGAVDKGSSAANTGTSAAPAKAKEAPGIVIGKVEGGPAMVEKETGTA
ncbi:hypothetical protein B0H13DRAFT_1981669 [Mycena leptocephala]|nr:hypothetical protein B0H13DRAFT_1981669 [Mycena leptocephala]